MRWGGLQTERYECEAGDGGDVGQLAAAEVVVAAVSGARLEVSVGHLPRLSARVTCIHTAYHHTLVGKILQSVSVRLSVCSTLSGARGHLPRLSGHLYTSARLMLLKALGRAQSHTC